MEALTGDRPELSRIFRPGLGVRESSASAVDGRDDGCQHQAAGRPSLVEDRRLRSARHVRQVRGAKPVEFEKGKAGIVVGSKEKLPALFDALIAAVRAGELDDLFSQAAKAGTIGKPRKAA